MKYGYIRPILKDLDNQQQLKELKLDHLFIETHGLSRKRTELENLLMTVNTGDHLFVQNIEVLADSLQQLLDILRLAERDNLIIHFIDEKRTNKTIEQFSLLQSADFFARLQSSFLSHSSTFTLQVAKEQGKAIGRPRKSDDNLKLAFDMYDSKTYTLFDIKEATGISKSTLYRYLDERAKLLDDH